MGEGNTGKTYTTAAIAKLFGVCPSSIKNYEKKLPPVQRTPGGHRRYTDVHVEALHKLFDQPDVSPPSPPVSEPETPNAGQ